MVHNLLFSVLAIFTASSICAQEIAPLATDRPDQTEGSSTVGKGVVQIETGYVITWEDLPTGPFDQDITHDFGTTLLRIGILDNLELRAGGAYTSYNPANGQDISGFSQIMVGTKIDIVEEHGAWPEMAFLGHLTLPWIATEAFAPNFIAPDFRFAFSHTLSERFSLGYNLGYAWNGIIANDAFVYTIAVGAGITQNLAIYAELYGTWPANASGEHSLDAGATYLFGPNIQADISYGFTYSGGEMSYLSLGLSFRIP